MAASLKELFAIIIITIIISFYLLFYLIITNVLNHAHTMIKTSGSIKVILVSSLFLFIAKFESKAAFCIPAPTGGLNGYTLSHIKFQSLDSNLSVATTYRYLADSLASYTCYLQRGFRYTIYLTSGTAHAVSTIAAWIDWNNDSIFSNSMEKAGEFTTTAGGQVDSLMFVVPLTAPGGKHRLRIRCSDNASINACANYSYGQTIDFTVTLLDPAYDYDFFNGWQSASITTNFIDRVEIGTIDNANTGGPGAPVYQDYSYLTATENACSQIDLTVTTNSSSISNFIFLYLDINGDGHFNQSDELIADEAVAAGLQSTLIQFSAPALSGKKRLRVLHYVDPTGIAEVEDYTIDFQPSATTASPIAAIGSDLFPDCNMGCALIACEGLNTFHDRSCGNPTSWNWSIPGASPSTSNVKDPSFTFVTGTYQVTLIVSNSLGSDTATATVSVQAPILNFSLGNDTMICPGGAFTLNAPVSQADCYKYSWSTGAIDTSISVTSTGTYSVFISYCDNVGCKAYDDIAVIVSPLVYNVTGGGNYCSGGAGIPVGVDDSQVGVSYQLMRNGIPVGGALNGTGSSISFGNQSLTGTYSVVATNASLACSVSMTGSVNVSVVPSPVSYHVTGGGSYCAGSGGLAIGLDSSQSGISYQLYRDGILVGLPVAGTGTSFSFPNHGSGGIYTVVASSGGACTATMLGSATISVVPSPAIFNVSGGGFYCEHAGAAVGLSDSELGVSYELIKGGLPTGITLAGTGSALSFASITSTGNYTVLASNDSTCHNTMNGAANIVIKPSPHLVNTTGGGIFCSGSQGASISVDSSEIGMNYRLYTGGFPSGGVVSGTGHAMVIGNPTVVGTYVVVATNTANGCSRTMNGVVIEDTLPAPFAHAVEGGGTYCTGDSGVVVWLNGSEDTVSYQLYVNNNPVGAPVVGDGDSISFGLQTLDGGYYVIATCSTSNCSAGMIGAVTVVEDICNKVVNNKSLIGIFSYPNPANDNLHIQFNVLKSSQIKLSMTDVLGKFKFEEFFLVHPDKMIHDINLKGYVPGIYLLNIIIGNEKFTERILIAERD